jgi:hypothetical protein
MAYVLAATSLVCLLATLESRGPAVVEGRGQAQRELRLGIPAATEDFDRQKAILLSCWLQKTGEGKGPKRKEQFLVLCKHDIPTIAAKAAQEKRPSRIAAFARPGVAYVLRR